MFGVQLPVFIKILGDSWSFYCGIMLFPETSIGIKSKDKGKDEANEGQKSQASEYSWRTFAFLLFFLGFRRRCPQICIPGVVSRPFALFYCFHLRLSHMFMDNFSHLLIIILELINLYTSFVMLSRGRYARICICISGWLFHISVLLIPRVMRLSQHSWLLLHYSDIMVNDICIVGWHF